MGGNFPWEIQGHLKKKISQLVLATTKIYRYFSLKYLAFSGFSSYMSFFGKKGDSVNDSSEKK